MVIPGEVKDTLAVNCYGDGVVGVLDVSGEGGLFDGPVFSVESAFRDDHVAVGVVVGGVLMGVVRGDGVFAEDGGVDGVLGPAGANGVELGFLGFESRDECEK